MDNQPNPAPAPVQPAQPVVPVQPTGPQVGYNPAAPAAPASSGGGKALKIVGGIVAAILLILAGLFILAMPALQASAKANKFMTAVKNNDEKTMQELSGSGRDGLTDKLNAALKTGTYKHTATDKEDKKFVVHFDVNGSDTVKDAAVVVEGGKVTNLLLNTKGGVTSASETNTAQTATSNCLTVDDLKSNGVTFIDTLGEKTYFSDLFFNADSTTYRSDSIAATELGKVADLYKKTSSKNYGFAVQGSVYESASTSSGVQLAKSRSQKVKDQLVSLGIPADKITVMEPTNGAFDAEATRNITVFLTTSSCTSNDSGR